MLHVMLEEANLAGISTGHELKVIFAGGLWFRRVIRSKVGSTSPFGSVNAEKLASKDTYARDKFSQAWGDEYGRRHHPVCPRSGGY